MGLFSNPICSVAPISTVVVFATDLGAAKMARKSGSVVQRLPPKTMFQTADAKLGLNGALVTFMVNESYEIEDAPEMSDADWSATLNKRFPGKKWDRWYGKTPNTIYSVVVVRKGVFVAGPKPRSKADKLTLWCMIVSTIPMACLLSVVKLADRSGDSWFFSVSTSCIAAAIYGILLGLLLSRIILGICWIVDLSRRK